MPATLAPSAHLGRRVIITLKAGTIYGSDGTFTLTGSDPVGLTLTSKRSTVSIPLSCIDTVTPIREEL